MRIETATATLLATARTDAQPVLDRSATRGVTQLLSLQASNNLGLQPAELPLSYRPVSYAGTELLERDVHEDRERAVTGGIYETPDVSEQRDVYEMRDIHETRIEGTRDLRAYDTLGDAENDVRAAFAVVHGGDGPTATFRLTTSERLEVTINGATQRFEFSSASGSLRNAIVGALNSVDGLVSRITSDGRLQFITDDAQQLMIADVADGSLDFSSSPLENLGLAEGTTTSRVFGTEQVQRGTERVKVGTEAIGRIAGSSIVGLSEEQDRGTAGITALDRLEKPHDAVRHLNELFETLSIEDGGAPAST